MTLVWNEQQVCNEDGSTCTEYELRHRGDVVAHCLPILGEDGKPNGNLFFVTSSLAIRSFNSLIDDQYSDGKTHTAGPSTLEDCKARAQRLISKVFGLVATDIDLQNRFEALPQIMKGAEWKVDSDGSVFVEVDGASYIIATTGGNSQMGQFIADCGNQLRSGKEG